MEVTLHRGQFMVVQSHGYIDQQAVPEATVLEHIKGRKAIGSEIDIENKSQPRIAARAWCGDVEEKKKTF